MSGERRVMVDTKEVCEVLNQLDQFESYVAAYAPPAELHNKLTTIRDILYSFIHSKEC